jgi:hypothetical protein
MSFLNRLSRAVRPKPAAGQRLRTFRPQLEQLDSRLLLSSGLSSAISIPHSGGVERDWFTVDATGVVEFQGTTRRNLGSPEPGSSLGSLCASVDPNTGSGEVFVLYNSHDPEDPFATQLALCDSQGTWHYLNPGGSCSCISATGDGHVYAAVGDYVFGGYDIRYYDSNDKYTDLGMPKNQSGQQLYTNNLAASVGLFGNNEVFTIAYSTIGQGSFPYAGYIYVNSTSTPDGWRPVDSRALFVALSATPNDTVFAVTTDGRLFQETEHLYWGTWHHYYYWTGQDISGGSRWAQISADTDASGRDEVYAVMSGANQLYLYDQGSWTWKDSDVYDVSGAGGGYFYDVNYASGNYNGWLYNPNGGTWFAWTYLGSGLG